MDCATLDIWHQEDPSGNPNEIEAVEAEVVFLIRKLTGQWPRYQTEIHFWLSTKAQRGSARRILGHYSIRGD